MFPKTETWNKKIGEKLPFPLGFPFNHPYYTALFATLVTTNLVPLHHSKSPETPQNPNRMNKVGGHQHEADSTSQLDRFTQEHNINLPK